MNSKDKDRIDCVGIICFRDDEVLLIRRAKAPRAGDWSLPGGRIEAGETQEQASLRELQEETGVIAQLGAKIAVIDADFEGFSYRLHDFIAEWQSGNPAAGDDAAEARFVSISQIGTLGMWPKTEEVILKAWSVIQSRADQEDALG